MSFENQPPAQAKYRESEKGRITARVAKRRWEANNPEKAKAQRRNSYTRHREARLRYVFERKYEITWEQRDAMLAAQGGACKLCGAADHGAKSRGWHTDHDAYKQKGEEGFIRGILCLTCNTGLGKFRHDLELLERAKQYLGGTCHPGR